MVRFMTVTGFVCATLLSGCGSSSSSTNCTPANANNGVRNAVPNIPTNPNTPPANNAPAAPGGNNGGAGNNQNPQNAPVCAPVANNGNGRNNGNGNNGGNNNGGNNNGENPALTDTDGQWSTECLAITEQSSLKRVYVVGQGKIKMAQWIFEGTTCTGNVGLESGSIGTLGTANGNQVPVTWESITAKPGNQNAANFLNQQALCGKTNWKANEQVNLTPQQCAQGAWGGYAQNAPLTVEKNADGSLSVTNPAEGDQGPLTFTR